MIRTMLAAFAAAALLSSAAGGSATATTDAALMPAGELRAGSLTRLADLREPAPAECRIRVAYSPYLKVDGVEGDVTGSTKRRKKGLRANPQSGTPKGNTAGRRRK